MAAQRNKQLDGWRAIAVVGVMWHHWAPKEWRGEIPFEIGLFFFLTLTGFLITRILLRMRTEGERVGGAWKCAAYWAFERRRLMRILIPCYAAMIFAIAVGASDIRSHPMVYFSHLSNFHMAWMDGWPSGTAHYWTLAIQMQFYVIWPLVIFGVPRWLMGWFFGGCLLIAPICRHWIDVGFPQIHHGEAISLTALDYFGAGALLALAVERGLLLENRLWGWLAWLAFAGYVALYGMEKMVDGRVSVLGNFQQTFLALAFAGMIGSTLIGFGGWRGWLLENPVIQYIGKISFGLYLFHTPVPLALGWVLPWLWEPTWDGHIMQGLRICVFALSSWGMAWFCWRWLENPEKVYDIWRARGRNHFE